MKVRIMTAVLALACAAVAQCGHERWPVKTMTDLDAVQVSMTPVGSSVSQLVAQVAPRRAQMPEDARLPAEMKTYTVTARLLRYKLEADQDVHLVLQGAHGETMVAEIPSAGCTTNASVALTFSGLRQWLANEWGMAERSRWRRPAGRPLVTVTGVGFFDFIHGQSGVARNGFELHPVLAMSLVR